MLAPRSSSRRDCCRRSTARATIAPSASASDSTPSAFSLYACVPVMLGMMRARCIPDLPQPELALPTLLVHDLPPVVGALGLAAVFSAEVSAADAVLFMLTTSLSQDFYKRLRQPRRERPAGAAAWRGSTAVLAGALGVAHRAWLAERDRSALSIFYTLIGRRPVRADPRRACSRAPRDGRAGRNRRHRHRGRMAVLVRPAIPITGGAPAMGVVSPALRDRRLLRRAGLPARARRLRRPQPAL